MRVGYFGTIASALALAALAGCAGTAGTAAAPETVQGDLELRASGSGNWDIDCVAVTRRGQARSDLKGRGATSTDTLFLRDVASAACTYTTGDSPVTLSLTEDGLACPFGDFENGLCRTVLSENTSGAIDFSSR